MQAILILAHKNFPQVKKLALKLNRSFAVYIHFDKKMNVTSKELASLSKHNIQYISEVAVNWGSWSIGEATVRLMKLALADPTISYLHVISGQDWITKNVDELYQRFEDDTKIYMTYEKASEVKKSGEPIIWWQKYYFNYDQVNRRTFFGKFYHRALLLGQTLFRVDKFKKLNIDLEIYAGAIGSICLEMQLVIVSTISNHILTYKKCYKLGASQMSFGCKRSYVIPQNTENGSSMIIIAILNGKNSITVTQRS